MAQAPRDPGDVTLPEEPGDAAAMPWPTTIDRYVVEGVLGAGGFGVVLSARDPELGRLVAIKLVASGGSREAQDRLLAEARAAARLSHQHVVAVYDVGEVGDRVWVALERVDGDDLEAWLERPRSRAEILEVFGQAGRGLAAAHRAGLVHRDFKPANVLLGRDGRARVADFGLARLTVSADAAASAGRDAPLLTQSGAAAGTPAYMAPEQLAGEPVTAAADQFAFCIALYRALTGRAPFGEGDTLQRLSAMDGGRVAGWPRERRVPGWLRAVVERGLRRDPRERFASMDDLLTALERGRSRQVRGWLLGAAVAAVLLTGGLFWAAAARTSAGPPCRGLERHLAGIWDAPRRETVRAAFAASGRAYGPALGQRVIEALDAWTRDWTALRVEVCEATRVRGEQSEELLDIKNLCLDRELAQLGALATLVAAPPSPTVIDEALGAAQRLPPVAACADSQRLSEVVPRPAGAEVRARIAAVEAELARARALQDGGDARAALPVAQAALVSAEAIAWAPLTAAALRSVADLEITTGALADADGHVARALAAAALARDAGAEADAWVLTVRLRAQQKRGREAIGLRPAVEVALTRAGNPPGAHIDALIALAAAYRVETDYEQQRALFEEALALAERSFGPDHLTTLSVVCGLAHALDDVREREAGLKLAERCLAGRQRALGERHPAVGKAWHTYGVLLSGLKKRAEAEVAITTAIDILIETMGPDTPELANFYSDRSIAQRRQEKYAAALDSAEHALAIDRKTYGNDHVNVGLSLEQTAHLLRDLERYDEALVYYREAIEIYARLLGPDHPYVGTAYGSMGETYEYMKRYDDAIDMQERAFAIQSKRPENCAQPFMVRITLAEPLVLRNKPGDKARALQLLREARDGLAACGPKADREQEKLAHMLESHHLEL